MSEVKKLYRSRHNRLIFGVCGGLADYFAIDVIVIRLIFVVLALGGGSGLVVYLIASIVIPNEGSVNGKISLNEGEVGEVVNKVGQKIKDLKTTNPKVDWQFLFGFFLIFLGLAMLISKILPFRDLWNTMWPIFLAVIGLVIIFKKRG